MDPTLDLALAAMNKLKATAAITALVAQRIYDRVPEKQTSSGPMPDVPFPYISLGPTSATSDYYDCIDGLEVTLQFDVWSSGSGEAYSSVQCRKIADLVRRALHDAELSLSSNALVTLTHRLTQIMRDPDGVTNHGVVQFMALVEVP